MALPGLRLNLSKRDASLNVGHRGGWLTFGPRGTRATFGGFGTGLYYTTKVPPAAPPNLAHQAGFGLGGILVLIVVVVLVD